MMSRPIPQRKRSLVGEVLDTSTIGQPDGMVAQNKEGRPRMHKRSLTGTYFPAGDQGHQAWPLGDETTWRKAMKEDAETTVPAITRGIVHNVTTALARQAFNIEDDEVAQYQAVALTARDHLIRNWNETQSYQTSKTPKRVYYLSLEFLMGRSLDNTLLNLSLKPQFTNSIEKLGFRLEDVLEGERDAGLGNGGLGRLAACYVDGMATLDLPGWGYGLRYQYGIFKQLLDKDGAQLEAPDPWLETQNPWEFPRLDVQVKVRFYGTAERLDGHKGKAIWKGGQEVLAVAYDVPVPGHNTKNTSNIRFWSAKPISGFDLASFSAGDYAKSVEANSSAETITRILYPNDNNDAGKELRLKQQYFWTAASLFDILRRFKKLEKPFSEIPDFIAIQLNDTHPTLAIPELMRILVDEENIDFDEAWSITRRTLSYTNHTVMVEALEEWSVPLMQHLLPRIMQIIFDINYDFMGAVERAFPGDVARLGRMSLIAEGYPQKVRMAHLAVIGSHKVNGVAELHSQLVQTQLFPDFVEFLGSDHFTNITNGITPRRWLDQCNPDLSVLITKTLGSSNWLKDLYLLKGLEKKLDDKAFRQAFTQVKKKNKERLAHLIYTELGTKVNTDALFDVQIKRLHEYKRQQMNIFGVIYRYLMLKKMTPAERKNVVPRVVIFAGKAAPGYYAAKLIIRLIVSVSKVINADKEIGDVLKLFFLPDYSVSLAEVIIPASDISQHISTAGTEASGTSNMKFCLNGGLLLGTVDGANVEIAEEVGEDNVFFFGYLTPQVEEVRYNNRYHQLPLKERSPQLKLVFDEIWAGTFGSPDIFRPLLDSIADNGDHYIVANDFASYIESQAAVDEAFKDKEGWARKSITTVARMGKFNSDRAVQQYAEEIWNVEPVPVPQDTK